MSTAITIDEKQLKEWAEQLVAVSDDGEAEEWKAAFSECWGTELTEKVIKIAREIWRARQERKDLFSWNASTSPAR
jgi:acetylornithine/succinyldiaminopimelate/putrescine aminotransferase